MNQRESQTVLTGLLNELNKTLLELLVEIDALAETVRQAETKTRTSLAERWLE